LNYELIEDDTDFTRLSILETLFIILTHTDALKNETVPYIDLKSLIVRLRTKIHE